MTGATPHPRRRRSAAALSGLVLVAALALPACRDLAIEADPEEETPVPTDVEAALGVPFRLGIGELGRIEAEDVGLRLLSITDDTRCPLDTDCPTAGQVGATFRIERDGAAPVTFQLWIPGLVEEPWLRGDVFQSERERFRLLWIDPYPEPGVEVPDDSVHAVVRIDHGI